jgi:hypothetical protein
MGTPELQMQINALFDRYASLEAEAQMSDIYDAIGRMDNRLVELPMTLENLRTRGFAHAGELEERLAAFDEQWDNARPRIEQSLMGHVQQLNNDLDVAQRQVSQLSAGNTMALSAANAAVNGLAQKINAAKSGLRSLFGGLENELWTIDAQIGQIDQMLRVFEQSTEVRLGATEGPLAAVTASWLRDGDEGPAGVLYLTDQRLLFEQIEEVKSGGLFGLFGGDTERVQRLLLEVPVYEIEEIRHSEEGGFLGMGKKDMLDLVLSNNAPVSRARFHLEGQDSADWATFIKQAQTGQLDRDRSDKYAEELERAESLVFPTQCPNCFAAVPPPPRGAPNTVCDFCGTVIMPAVSDDAG